MSRFQDCSVSIWEYGEKEMVLGWVETGKGKKEGTLSLHHEINQNTSLWNQQTSNYAIHNMCFCWDILELLLEKSVQGSDAVNEPTCEKLACRFCCKYTVQFTKLFVMFSWQRLFDLNHWCGPVMPCFLICSCCLPFFFSSLASRVSVTREAQSSYSSARCFTAFIMGNRSSSVYL